MSKGRKLLLAAFTLFLLVVIVLTWGSIGSAALVLCLFLMGASLLYQRFLINYEDNDYDMEQ